MNVRPILIVVFATYAILASAGAAAHGAGVVSGAMESNVNDGDVRVHTPAPAGPNRPVRLIRSVGAQAEPNRRSCWPCSSSTATKRS